MKTGLLKDEFDVRKFFENYFSFETTYTRDMYLSLVNIFSILKDEVEKFNEYVVNKFPDTKISSTKNIDRIILCGRSSILPGLSKHINQHINAEIKLADTLTNVFDVKEYSSSMKFNDSVNFVTPIGLVVSSCK